MKALPLSEISQGPNQYKTISNRIWEKYFGKEIKGSAESDGHIIVVGEKKETIKGNRADDAIWIKLHIRRFDKDCKIGR